MAEDKKRHKFIDAFQAYERIEILIVAWKGDQSRDLSTEQDQKLS